MISSNIARHVLRSGTAGKSTPQQRGIGFGSLYHRRLGQLASGCSPGCHSEVLEHRRAVLVERAIGMGEIGPVFNAEPAGHVLNDRRGDVLDASKSADGLKNLQLHEQRHLG